jgi:hypothetical protein
MVAPRDEVATMDATDLPDKSSLLKMCLVTDVERAPDSPKWDCVRYIITVTAGNKCWRSKKLEHDFKAFGEKLSTFLFHHQKERLEWPKIKAPHHLHHHHHHHHPTDDELEDRRKTLHQWVRSYLQAVYIVMREQPDAIKIIQKFTR